MCVQIQHNEKTMKDIKPLFCNDRNAFLLCYMILTKNEKLQTHIFQATMASPNLYGTISYAYEHFTQQLHVKRSHREGLSVHRYATRGRQSGAVCAIHVCIVKVAGRVHGSCDLVGISSQCH